MSERGSFTTQYFYNDRDYEIIRKALDKFLLAPPYKEKGVTIVSGFVSGSLSSMEWLGIVEALYGVVTEDEVNVVIICDSGRIVKVTKDPDGFVLYERLS